MENTRKTKRNSSEDDRNVRGRSNQLRLGRLGRLSPLRQPGESFNYVQSNMRPLNEILAPFSHAKTPDDASPDDASPDDASPAVASPAVASPAVASPAVASPAVASPAVASPAIASSVDDSQLEFPTLLKTLPNPPPIPPTKKGTEDSRITIYANPLSLLPPIPSEAKSFKFESTSAQPPTSSHPSAKPNSLVKSRLLKRIRHAREEITHDIEELEEQEQEIKKKRADLRKEVKENKDEDDQKKIRDVLEKRFRQLNDELKQVSHEAMQSKKDVIGLTFEKNRLREMLIGCVEKRDKAEKKLEVWNGQLDKLNSESKKTSISAEKREKIKDLEGQITGAVDNLKAVMKKMDEETIFFHARKLEWIDAEMKKLKDKRSELSKKMIALRNRRDPLARQLMSQKTQKKLATELKQYDDDEKSGGRKTRKIKKRTTRSNKSRVYASRTPKIRTSALFK